MTATFGRHPAWFGSPVHPFKSLNLGRNSVDILTGSSWSPTNEPTNEPTSRFIGSHSLSPRRPSPPKRRCCSESQERRASWRVMSCIPSVFWELRCILSHSIPNDWWSKWEGLNINKHHEKCIEMYQTCLNISEHEYQLPSHLSPAPPSVASCELPPGHVARPAAAAAPHRPVSMPGRWPGDPCWSLMIHVDPRFDQPKMDNMKVAPTKIWRHDQPTGQSSQEELYFFYSNFIIYIMCIYVCVCVLDPK